MQGVVVRKPRGMKCPNCGSTHIWAKGFSPTRRGKLRRWMCADCARSWDGVLIPWPKAEKPVTEEPEATG